MKHYLAIFAGGDFESVESFATVEQRAAYAEGIVRGGSLYEGSIGTYDLPEQLNAMARDEPHAVQAVTAWRTASV